MNFSAANESVSVVDRYRQVVAELGHSQKKRARGAPAYSIYVNRPLGRRLAAAAHLLGLSPNTISLISAVFTFGAITTLAVAPPTPLVGFLVAGLLIIGYAFDSADGQVARLRGGGTPAGEWLDHVLDCIKCSTLHLAVLISMYLHFGLSPESLLLIPLAFSAVSAISFFAAILNEQLKARHGSGTDATSSKESTPLRALMGVPTDYGLLCLSFVFLGWNSLFLIIYALLFLATAGYLALALIKWFGDMKRLA